MIEKLNAVAIDVETTGLDPLTDAIWEVAIVPLNDVWLPSKTELPLHLFIAPEVPLEAIDFSSEVMRNNKARIAQAYKSGVDHFTATNMLETWFKTHYSERVVPLGQSVRFDLAFLEEFWPRTREVFNYRVRDTMITEAFLRDRAVMRGEQRWKTSMKLVSLRHQYGIEDIGAHNALADAITCAKIYNQQISKL